MMRVAPMRSLGEISSGPAALAAARSRRDAALRMAWTVVSIVVVETVICGAALLPVVFLWSRLAAAADAAPGVRLVLFSLALVPSYVLFGLLLMLISPLVVRAMNWHTPLDVETRIADMEWPLLQWTRYMVASHVVRIVAGSIFRGSPIWTAYLRLAGARIGRRVYVNSLAVADYNLLDFGDDVVIGDGVHLSGHTIEEGVLKTARVRLGRSVTIGVGSIVGIGVDAAEGCQVGALSLVPKYTQLDACTTYVGVPAQPSRVSAPRQPEPQQSA
jgi:acetyltransferase-like isoleucine patch superfamily enzyme